MVDDVRFDPAASRRAADALRALHRRLEAATDERERALARARTDWRGRASEQARARAEQEHRRAGDLVDDLRRDAARIDAGLDEALAEQARQARARRLLGEVAG